jgi:nitrogen regulatory protein PII
MLVWISQNTLKEHMSDKQTKQTNHQPQRTFFYGLSIIILKNTKSTNYNEETRSSCKAGTNNCGKTTPSRVRCSGMTILDASGWSKMREFHLQWRGQDIAYDLVPKVKLEVVIPDSQLDSVVQAITESARTEEGEHGDGVIFIFTIDEVVNIG